MVQPARRPVHFKILEWNLFDIYSRFILGDVQPRQFSRIPRKMPRGGYQRFAREGFG